MTLDFSHLPISIDAVNAGRKQYGSPRVETVVLRHVLDRRLDLGKVARDVDLLGQGRLGVPEDGRGLVEVVRGRGAIPGFGAETLADGIAVKRPGDLTSEIVRERVHEILLVPEDALEEAIGATSRSTTLTILGGSANAIAYAVVGFGSAIAYLQRVAVQDHQVGGFAALDRAEFLLYAQGAGAVEGGDPDRVGVTERRPFGVAL